jgi:exonuclease SbcC
MSRTNYISEITIQNFQSHSYTTLQPAEPGKLTVIVGPSDSGKTAIIRALRWLTYNTPSGTDFIKIGSNQAKVSMTMDTGHIIIRQRSRGGINRYIVDAPDGPEQVFEGFGNIVPLEVQQITGISPIEIGDMTLNLNLSEQLDGPFLGKSISAPARAKVLGKLAGTEEIDYAARLLQTDLYRCRQDEKRLAAEIESLTNQIDDYNYLEDLKETVDAIKEKWAEIKEKSKLVKALSELQTQQQELIRKKKEQQAILDNLRQLDEAANLLQSTEKQFANYTKLLAYQSQAQMHKSRLIYAQFIMERTDEIFNAENLLTAISYQCQKLCQVQRLKEKRESEVTALEAASSIIRKTNFIDEAEINLTVLPVMAYDLTRLKRLTEQRSRIVGDLDNAEKILDSTSRIHEAEGLFQNVWATEEIRKKCVSLIQRRDDLQALLSGAQHEIHQLTHEAEKHQAEYINFLVQVGVCPTCGGKVSHENLKEVI